MPTSRACASCAGRACSPTPAWSSRGAGADGDCTTRAAGTLGTLQLSIQDVIGYVKYMHRNYHVDVVVRGRGAGHVRTSLPAAASMSLAELAARSRSAGTATWCARSPSAAWPARRSRSGSSSAASVGAGTHLPPARPARRPPLAQAWASGAAAVAAVTAIAAALRLASFGTSPPNPFYDAAVRSMGLSWHNFFFGAFEPGGQVVDRQGRRSTCGCRSRASSSSASARRRDAPARGRWRDRSRSPLLYDLVRRLFGPTAGLAAAAALAVLPVAVLTARSDTMDSVMMALDVLAAWLVVVRRADRRSAWPLVAAGAVIGPRLQRQAVRGARRPAGARAARAARRRRCPWRRRAPRAGRRPGARSSSSALAWIDGRLADAAGARPWPIGSTNGSIWNVVFVFNGIDRLRAPRVRGRARARPAGRRCASSRRRATTTPSLVGTTLLAALVFGVIALRRRGGRAPARASTSACRSPAPPSSGLWLIVGVAALSNMQRLQPRYLEAVDPGHRGHAGRRRRLAGRPGAQRRAPRRSASPRARPSSRSWRARSSHPPGWATTAALAAAAGTLTCALSARRAGA